MNEKGYVISASSCALNTFNLWEFNPITNAWTFKSTVPLTTMSQREGVALFTIQGKLYTGLGDANGNPDVWQWTASSNTWFKIIDFLNAYTDNAKRIGAIAYESCNGNGYLLGGNSAGTFHQEYNPITNIWRPEGPMVNTANGQYVSFAYGSSFKLNNRIYVLQGENPLQNFMWESDPIAEFTVGPISPTSICTKSTFNVPFSTYCNYNAGNVFTAQLSDAAGSFANPLAIGTLTATSSGTISANIPSANTGTGYRIRVISSNPYKISTDNGVNLNVFKTANVSFSSGPSLVNLTDPALALYGGSPAGGTYSGTGVTGGNTFNPTTAGLGTHTITYTYNGCSNTAINTITVATCDISNSTGSWTAKANFTGTARSEAVSFSIGGKGYIVSGVAFGEVGTRFRDVWEYNPTNNTWTQKANLPGSIRSDAFSFVIGTKGYIGGGRLASGSSLNDFWEFIPSSNLWISKPNFPATISSASAFSIGTAAYVVGGILGNGGITNNVWLWNGTAWSLLPNNGPRPSARYSSLGFSIGTKGYICTGRDLNNDLKDFWEFNPILQTWIQKTDFPGLARRGATAS
ncbi:MAG: hypothetical protein K2Q22_13545, partial [Cytophagales bacterium]|nr:hypothetical protein [Cytophagales bacterium]